MPYVEESIIVTGDVEQAYNLAKNMEDYPKFMPDVVKVEVLEEKENTTITSWITKIDGHTISWTERDLFNDDEYQIIYEQIKGDLKEFAGEWKLEVIPEGTKITLIVNFEFGIPMLAKLLNPILQKKVKKNSQNMLQAIKKEVEQQEKCS